MVQLIAVGAWLQLSVLSLQTSDVHVSMSSQTRAAPVQVPEALHVSGVVQ
jgi:hypothetical protein